VPRMASGKTLPCFAPFDAGARSGGFIGDRFLSGLRPQVSAVFRLNCVADLLGVTAGLQSGVRTCQHRHDESVDRSSTPAVRLLTVRGCSTTTQAHDFANSVFAISSATHVCHVSSPRPCHL